MELFGHATIRILRRAIGMTISPLYEKSCAMSACRLGFLRRKIDYAPPSQRVMMRSFPAVARYFPSDERVIPLTGPLCDRIVLN